VTITARELALVRKLLAEQAKRIRVDAPARIAAQPHRLVREGMADILEMAACNCEELAGRLARAIPGESIHVVPGDA